MVYLNKLRCILIIEDDAETLAFQETILQSMGIAEVIESVSDGLQGLQFLKDKLHPDLILLDLNMPLVGGLEFLDFFNRLEFEGKEKTKIIILTVSKRDYELSKALALGASDWLIKPITEEKIKQVIEEHCKDRIKSSNYK